MTPDVVYRRPATRFAADFIGHASFLSGDVLAADGEAVDISMLSEAMQIPSAGGHRAGDTAVVVAGPESIRVGEGALRARVKGSGFLGSYVEYELELADGQENMLAERSHAARAFSR